MNVSARTYYVVNSTGEHGPLDHSELVALVRAGTVARDDRVRNAFGRQLGTVGEIVGSGHGGSAGTRSDSSRNRLAQVRGPRQAEVAATGEVAVAASSKTMVIAAAGAGVALVVVVVVVVVAMLAKSDHRSESGQPTTVVAQAASTTHQSTFKAGPVTAPDPANPAKGKPSVAPPPAAPAVDPLLATFYSANLRQVVADDWLTIKNLTTAGQKRIPAINWTSSAFGTPAEQKLWGIKSFNDNWNDFSVQVDGALVVDADGIDIGTRSDDGSRMWLDRDRDGVVDADEWCSNGWGGGQAPVSKVLHLGVQRGTYRFRLQYEGGDSTNELSLLWNHPKQGSKDGNHLVVVPAACFAASDSTAAIAAVSTVRMPIAIDCGSSKEIVASDGTEYLRDAYPVSGSPAAAATQPITGTKDPGIYATSRSGQKVTYAIPVPGPGTYRVTFQLCETQVDGPGKRVFSLVGGPNAQTVLFKSVDIFALAGGAAIAHDLVADVTVTASPLTISAIATVGTACINGLRVVPVAAAQTPKPKVSRIIAAIDCGSTQDTTAGDGTIFVKDAHFIGGGARQAETVPITKTGTPAIYLSYRFGEGDGFNYAIPVPEPGSYRVTFLLCETWFTERGQRSMDLTNDGRVLVAAVDIIERVGRNTACSVVTTATTTTKVLTVGVIGKVAPAVLSGLKVERLDP